MNLGGKPCGTNANHENTKVRKYDEEKREDEYDSAGEVVVAISIDPPALRLRTFAFSFSSPYSFASFATFCSKGFSEQKVAKEAKGKREASMRLMVGLQAMPAPGCRCYP
jgi:hypothetical protein